MRIGLVIFFLTVGIHSSAQNIIKPKPKKEYFKKTDFGIGVGVTRSVVFLSRNIREFNDATGIDFHLIYGGHNLVRFAFNYIDYRNISIQPTWLDIKARTYDFNFQFLARFRELKALMYPIIGLSYNQFKGFFTGMDDYQGLRDYYPVNEYVSTNWWGANFGLGYEQQIGPVKLVISYKMRVGTADVSSKVNIMDVCYGLGLRHDFKVSTPRHLYRKIFRSTRNRYELDV